MVSQFKGQYNQIICRTIKNSYEVSLSFLYYTCHGFAIIATRMVVIRWLQIFGICQIPSDCSPNPNYTRCLLCVCIVFTKQPASWTIYTYTFVKHDLDNMTTILPGFPLETTNLTAIFGFFNITTIANTKIERTTAEKCMETTSNSYLNDALY